ncbi:SDR family NAD(P)-dependent oxidoreductase [Microbacterium sp. CFH 90308]|uniref:SDR family NAD(P)-dependent oxidoreductase n=1 Tax=Microbacterium salsuginis TaxID=2722803 RepID=A0ABX1KC16_9MICO|nr:SDR family NAD(P)-dependent oxidoreductase [Microbacterium sp. CFH 90308]NLP83513.1 SDR family NAD(P)-dependent oxidoreductase [Microbacterium sp. CFH 90308]
MTRPVVITGALSGLGLELARTLAGRGRTLIVTGRDAGRAAEVAQALSAQHEVRVQGAELDLADLRSVAAATLQLRRLAPAGLAGVVCNGGVQIVDGVRRSADGFELTFATNHLGHFALVTGLLDVLPDGGSLTVVSSGTHAGPRESLGFPAPAWQSPARLADPDRADPSPRAGRVRYSTSKLANVYFAYELARRHPRLRVEAFDPGLMPATGLSRGYPPSIRRLYAALAPAVAAFVPGARSARTAAGMLADLVADGVQRPEGRYVAGASEKPSSRESYDRARASELWTESEELVRRALPLRDGSPRV